MPFGGLLTAGISAGSSIFGGLMGGKGAKKAAAAANAKSQEAINYQKEMLGGNIADIRDAEMRSNNALGDARDEGQQLVKSATQGGLDANLAATEAGQQGVREGVTGANQILTDSQKAQLAQLSPYATAGQTSLTSLQQLAGAGGPLTNKFSFNPSDLQNDPGYAFTLQQGQDALQRSAAAKGQLFSGGTLKSLAGYTTGTANQYFNDAFNRSKTTFDTNQQQALSRISTLQGLAGMGYNASTAGANAIGSTSGQMAANTLGGSQFVANLGEQGAQFGANLGETGAQYRSNLGAATASQISGNNVGGSNLRTTLGANAANQVSHLLTGQGENNAAGVLGSTGSWLDALNSGTQGLLTFLGRPNSGTTSSNSNPNGALSFPPNPGYDGAPAGTA